MTSTAVAPKIVGKALYLELVADTASHDSETIRKVLGWLAKSTKQIIIFPEYQDDAGTLFGAVVMERNVSASSPKAQWDTTYTDRNRVKVENPDEASHRGYVTHSRYTHAEWLELTKKEKLESRKLALSITLRNLTLNTTWAEPNEAGEILPIAKQVWAVREGKPISVEITDQDMKELHKDSKTPQAVIRRINKVRGTLDKFPEKLA